MQPFWEGGLVTVLSGDPFQTELFMLGWKKLLAGDRQDLRAMQTFKNRLAFP